MEFSIKDFFCKCDQIPSFSSHLLKKCLMELFFFFFFFLCSVQKKKRKRPIYKASVMINFSFFHFSITKSVYHISKIVFSFIKSQYYTEMRKKWHLPLNLNLKFFYKISLQGDLFIKAK